jgi:hypothetical protein
MSEVRQSFRIILDAYPAIAEKIKLFWGEQEFTDLVHDLINDTRDGARKGFSFEVSAALITLQHWHDHHFPKHAQRTRKEWSLNGRPASRAAATGMWGR